VAPYRLVTPGSRELFPELTHPLVLGAREIKPAQSLQHRDKLWGVSHLLAQLVRPGVGVFHFPGPHALHRDERRGQSGLQEHLLLRAFDGVWEGREHVQAPGEVTDGLKIGRALDGALARPLPVSYGLRARPASV
jgi:hypothetical protein